MRDSEREGMKERESAKLEDEKKRGLKRDEEGIQYCSNDITGIIGLPRKKIFFFFFKAKL